MQTDWFFSHFGCIFKLDTNYIEILIISKHVLLSTGFKSHIKTSLVKKTINV